MIYRTNKKNIWQVLAHGKALALPWKINSNNGIQGFLAANSY